VSGGLAERSNARKSLIDSEVSVERERGALARDTENANPEIT
jgi:hypothetical protein